MKLPKVTRCLLIFWGALSSALIHAAPVRLLVQDQHGEPLSGAVVEVFQPPASGISDLPMAVMDQREKRFVPELLLVRQGQQVSFPNSDNIRHHVYSFSLAKTFELKLYSGHPEQPLSFDQPGVVVLGCNIHDAMVGYIYVAASALVALTDSDGIAIVHAHQLAEPQLFVWHPLQTAAPEARVSLALQDPALKRLADGALVVSLSITDPAPRDTFQAKFRAAEK